MAASATPLSHRLPKTPMLEFGGYTIVPGAIEALGPVRPKHEGGQRVFSFAIYLRSGQALGANFSTDEEAAKARDEVIASMLKAKSTPDGRVPSPQPASRRHA
jgi:hypothetical protein